MYILRTVLGVLSILVGIFGLFLPVIPGIALIIFGLFLIHPEWVKKKIKDSPLTKKYQDWQAKRKKRE